MASGSAPPILSYNGRLAFGITGDFDTAPDVGVLARAIEAGIKELEALATRQRPQPTASAPAPGNDTRGASLAGASSYAP